ncbi:MAG: DNA-directed RNA polymerase subunit alpha [Deltaproteobacteria bacterium]|nr:DNA-directed RNA polymerase subunit alpha [Deltaproteobacteria bacterium]
MKLTGFQRPKRLNFELDTMTETYGKFYAQPFERGFGTTIGNSLRRILLSSIEGAAITSVKFEGVLHEFSTLAGVLEDVAEIILNLKGVSFKMHTDQPKTIHLKARGKGMVTAGDIETDADLEVINPKHHIATLEKDSDLDMEMEVRMGRGYVPATEDIERDQAIGVIPIDAVFSPIRKVNFTVENARVGHATDYDKLTLEVWTNGAIKPDDAVAYAAKILKDYMTIFINFDEEVEEEEPVKDEKDEELRKFLRKSVEELELSVRSYNCLKKAEIKTIGELVQKTDSEMLRTKNFGRKSLNEIKELLTDMGLSLGMKVDDDLLQPGGAVEEEAS